MGWREFRSVWPDVQCQKEEYTCILPHSFTVWKLWFLGLQSRDQASMLVNDFFFAEFFAEFVRKHTIKFLAEGETFVLAHPHGCRDVSYKPAIQQTSHLLGSISGTCRVRQGLPPLLRLNTRFGLRAWRLHITWTSCFLWSCGLTIWYIIICFALTSSSFVVGTFFTGKMVKMRNDSINCILENLFKLNGSLGPFFLSLSTALHLDKLL